jgi:hypothetical protein
VALLHCVPPPPWFLRQATRLQAEFHPRAGPFFAVVLAICCVAFVELFETISKIAKNRVASQKSKIEFLRIQNFCGTTSGQGFGLSSSLPRSVAPHSSGAILLISL